MGVEGVVLRGKRVRLEPMARGHIDGFVAAASADRSLYQWSPVPRDETEATAYVETALAWQDAGKALPFAIINTREETNDRMKPGGDGEVVIGSTRFFDLERWAWPPGHPRHDRGTPDACEIGHSWLAHSAIRTGANTEAKLLMLTYAFETWQVLRVCLHTDVRNQRSRDAIERIGGKFEGVLRAHRMAADFTARDSARFSIVAAEWPDVKQRLSKLLNRV